MKIQLFLGAVFLVMASLSAQAQATTGTKNAASNGAVRHQSGGRSPKNSNAMTSATVDGSDGSATNDGASGQSGNPAPLPALSAGQSKGKIGNGRKPKASTTAASRKATAPGRQ